MSNMYASVTGVSNIHSVNVSTSHESSTATAIIVCENKTINIGDEVSVDIGYTTDHAVIFTGYVKQIEFSAPTGLWTVTAHDAMIKAVDYFVASSNPEEPYSKSNIKAEDLVQDILALATLTSYSYDPTFFTFAVTEGVVAEVNLVGAYDYCKSIADLLTWHLYAGTNKTIYFVNRKPYVMDGASGQPGDVADTPIKTITDSTILTMSYRLSEKDLRNKIVVYGSVGVYASDQSSTSYNPQTDSMEAVLPGGFYKTAVLASPIISTTGDADTIAEYNLDRLNRLTWTISISVLGDPDLLAREVITVNSTKLGVNDDFYILSAEHSWDSNGYVVSMELTA